ncbi:uncharacterized protein V6R79_011254 [Siganus canaliculatus]
MACKLVFLLAVFGVASAKLPYPRTCEQVESQDTPTLCSNYENIKYLDGVRKMLQQSEAALRTRITAVEAKVTQLEKARTEFEAQLKDIQSASTAPQIAFSTSLVNSGHIYRGPGGDKTLVFKRIFTNNGSAYNENTGVFTAPVKGVYFFTFTTLGCKTYLVGARLMKNGVQQVSTYDPPSTDVTDSSTNAAILRLEAEDTVHVELFSNARVYDSTKGHTTFSGFLVFPL